MKKHKKVKKILKKVLQNNNNYGTLYPMEYSQTTKKEQERADVVF